MNTISDKDLRFWPFLGPVGAVALLSLHIGLDLSPPEALHYGTAFFGSGFGAFLVAGALWITRHRRHKPDIWMVGLFFVLAGALTVVAFPLGLVGASALLAVFGAVTAGGSLCAFLAIQQ